MLYNIFVGTHSDDILIDWELKKDDQYDYEYFTCESIKQRIRLWKHTPNTLTLGGSNDSISTEDGDHYLADTVSYDIGDNTFFSNNYKNMSLMLMKAKKGVLTNDTIRHVAYVTLFNKDYKLLRYKVSNDSDSIIQTYRKKDEYQGCVIGITNDNANGSTIMELDVIDHTNGGKFTNIKISIGNDGVPTVESTVYQKKDKVLSGLSNKFKDRTLSFKMTVKKGTVPTNTFITTDQHYKELESILQQMHIGDNRILVLAGDDALEYLNDAETIDDCTDLDEYDANTHNVLTETTIKNRVRAITTYKIELPYKFCKIYKILYLFKMDEDGKVICLRSN